MSADPFTWTSTGIVAAVAGLLGSLITALSHRGKMSAEASKARAEGLDVKVEGAAGAVIDHLVAQVARQGQRIETLEAKIHDRDRTIHQLERENAALHRQVDTLAARVEQLEKHR